MRFEQGLRYCAIVVSYAVGIELMAEQSVVELKTVTPQDNQAELAIPEWAFAFITTPISRPVTEFAWHRPIFSTTGRA